MGKKLLAHFKSPMHPHEGVFDFFAKWLPGWAIDVNPQESLSLLMLVKRKEKNAPVGSRVDLIPRAHKAKARRVDMPVIFRRHRIQISRLETEV